MLSLEEGTDCEGRRFCCVNSDFKKILQFHEALFFKCCLHYLWLWAHFLKSDLKCSVHSITVTILALFLSLLKRAVRSYKKFLC